MCGGGGIPIVSDVAKGVGGLVKDVIGAVMPTPSGGGMFSQLGAKAVEQAAPPAAAPVAPAPAAAAPAAAPAAAVVADKPKQDDASIKAAAAAKAGEERVVASRRRRFSSLLATGGGGDATGVTTAQPTGKPTLGA